MNLLQVTERAPINLSEMVELMKLFAKIVPNVKEYYTLQKPDAAALEVFLFCSQLIVSLSVKKSLALPVSLPSRL
jgi:hypothetical protein